MNEQKLKDLWDRAMCGERIAILIAPSSIGWLDQTIAGGVLLSGTHDHYRAFHDEDFKSFQKYAQSVNLRPVIQSKDIEWLPKGMDGRQLSSCGTYLITPRGGLLVLGVWSNEREHHADLFTHAHESAIMTAAQSHRDQYVRGLLV